MRARLLLATAESEPGVCAIGVSAGEAGCTLHPAMYEIIHQAWRDAGATRREPLVLVSREWLDRKRPGWRNMAVGRPAYLVQDEHALQIVPAPCSDGELLLEGYRLPLKRMAEDEDEPGISTLHHIHLVQWALHLGFSVPDSESFDPARAQHAESEFTRYFGSRPDADLRRTTREDEPQVVQAIWP